MKINRAYLHDRRMLYRTSVGIDYWHKKYYSSLLRDQYEKVCVVAGCIGCLVSIMFVIVIVGGAL